MDDPAKVTSSPEPPWHNPDLSTLPPEPSLPKEPPAPPIEPAATVELPPKPLEIFPVPEAPSVPPLPPLPPLENKPPENTAETPLVIQSTPPLPSAKALKKAKGGGKAVLAVLALLVLSAAGVMGYFMVQQGGLPFNLGKKAAGEADCQFGDTNCPNGGKRCCDGRLVDGACKYQDDIGVKCTTCSACVPGDCGCGCPDSCQSGGTTPQCQLDSECPAGQKCQNNVCVSGGTTPQCQLDSECSTGQKCQNGTCVSGGTNACGGQEYACEGQSNNDGSVGVRNCSNVTKFYTCQKESDRFTSVSACQAAVKTTQGNITYSGMEVKPGEVGTCSVDAGGSCNLGQADILPQGSSAGICWDVKRDCSNCGAPTNTPIPTITPPVSGTPIPVLGACTNLEVYKAMVAPQIIADEPPGALPATQWHVGDHMMIKVTFTEPVEDVAVRIIRDGAKVMDISREQQVPGSKSNPWVPSYPITDPGNYEVQAFVKVNGEWK